MEKWSFSLVIRGRDVSDNETYTHQISKKNTKVIIPNIGKDEETFSDINNESKVGRKALENN